MTRAGEVEVAGGVAVALMVVVEVAGAATIAAAAEAPVTVALTAATTGLLAGAVVVVATVVGHPEEAATTEATSPTAEVAEAVVGATVVVTMTGAVEDLEWVDLGVEGITATGRAATVTTGSRSRNSTYENHRQNLQRHVRS